VVVVVVVVVVAVVAVVIVVDTLWNSHAKGFRSRSAAPLLAGEGHSRVVKA
jgi:FtsZ-interacting cell division protein ZipA